MALVWRTRSSRPPRRHGPQVLGLPAATGAGQHAPSFHDPLPQRLHICAGRGHQASQLALGVPRHMRQRRGAHPQDVDRFVRHTFGRRHQPQHGHDVFHDPQRVHRPHGRGQAVGEEHGVLHPRLARRLRRIVHARQGPQEPAQRRPHRDRRGRGAKAPARTDPGGHRDREVLVPARQLAVGEVEGTAPPVLPLEVHAHAAAGRAADRRGDLVRTGRQRGPHPRTGRPAAAHAAPAVSSTTSAGKSQPSGTSAILVCTSSSARTCR